MYDAHARIGALCCFLTIVSGHALVHADQVVVTDVTYTHSNDTTENSHHRLPPRQGSPANWMSPVDYTKGSVHILVEVKTKPGNAPTKFQICFEGDPNYACTDQSATYTATGKQEWVSPFSKFWYSGDMDWAQGIQEVALILKDTQNMPRTEAAYLPTDLRVQVTLLSEGATYTPPGATGAPAAGAPAAGAPAPGAAGRSAAGMGGGDEPDDEPAAGSGVGAAGMAGAAAGAVAAGTGAAETAGAAGMTAAVGRGAAGARSSSAAGSGGARSAVSGAGGAATSSRSDADSAHDEFQYPSGNESNCSVGRGVAARPAGTHAGFSAVLALALLVRVRGQRRRRRALAA
jgi:hypothetical protein